MTRGQAAPRGRTTWPFSPSGQGTRPRARSCRTGPSEGATRLAGTQRRDPPPCPPTRQRDPERPSPSHRVRTPAAGTGPCLPPPTPPRAEALSSAAQAGQAGSSPNPRPPLTEPRDLPTALGSRRARPPSPSRHGQREAWGRRWPEAGHRTLSTQDSGAGRAVPPRGRGPPCALLGARSGQRRPDKAPRHTHGPPPPPPSPPEPSLCPQRSFTLTKDGPAPGNAPYPLCPRKGDPSRGLTRTEPRCPALCVRLLPQHAILGSVHASAAGPPWLPRSDSGSAGALEAPVPAALSRSGRGYF